MPVPVPLAICVPVRNEAAAIGGLVAALGDLDLSGTDTLIAIFLDRCDDDTGAVLRAAGRALPCRLRLGGDDASAAPNAGRARRAAMALGLDHVAQDGILLTTDADSRPRPDWVQAALRALAVADVAAGRIIRSAGARDVIQTRVELYYDRLHRYRRTVDPVAWDDAGGHHFGGGANLAFRAAAYRAIGGFRPIPSAEDATALDDAGRDGLRVRRDGAMVVETSSRRIGRATGGLAAALREIDFAGMPHVTHPAAVAWQYRAHALARSAFATLADPAVRVGLGDHLGLSGDHVLGVGRDCRNAEAFAMRIVPAPPPGHGPLPLDEAEAALARLEHGPCEQAA